MTVILNDSTTFSRQQDCTLIADGRKRRFLLVSSRKAFEGPAATPFLVQPSSVKDAERLLANGFTPRSDGYFERNICPSCAICIPLRLPLGLFVQNNTEHRRILRKNENLSLQYGDGMPDLFTGGDDNVILKLMMKYSAARFPERLKKQKDEDGNSYKFDPFTYLDGFRDMGGLTPYHIEARNRDGEPVGYIIYNVGKTAAYGSVFFYEPALRSQSIGHYLMLRSIEKLQARGISQLYLSNWSSQATSYSWKTKYEPVEMFINNKWSAPLRLPQIRNLRTGNKESPFPPVRLFAPTPAP